MTDVACPRCLAAAEHALLAVGQGLLGEHVCGRCLGRFLPAELTERVVVDELGIDRGILRELVTHYSGASLDCVHCHRAMRPLRLRGVVVDLCLACGGLWLDAGELTRLSGGRYDETGPTLEPSTPAPTTAAWAGSGVEETRRIVLGRGHMAVVLDVLAEPPVAALRAAFARTDGLTSLDAEQIASFTHGVIVEGATPTGAMALAAALADEGVAAHVVGDATLRLPTPTVVERLDVVWRDEWRGIVAQFAFGPPLRIRATGVRAVGGGLVPARDERQTPVAALDVVVPAALASGAEIRRLRWLPVAGVDDEAVSAVAGWMVESRVAAGRLLRGGALRWPSYPSGRDLDRELAWLIWRTSSP